MSHSTTFPKNGKPLALPLDAKELKGRFNDPFKVCSLFGLDEGTKREGSGLRTHCPNPEHEDNSPSCLVDVGNQGTVRARCFACGFRGDIFDIIRLVKGCGFREALRIAAALAEQLEKDQIGGRRILAAPPKVALSSNEFNFVASMLLRASPLDRQPDVYEYLERRHIAEQAIGDGWGALPIDVVGQNRVRDEIVGQCGNKLWNNCELAGAYGSFTWHKNRLLIPYKDPAGRITSIVRRMVVVPVDGDKRYVNPRGRKPRWPYGIEQAANSAHDQSAVAFVEGAIDVLNVRKLYPNSKSELLVLGLAGLDQWVQEFAAVATGRDAVIAVDNDDAGNRAAAGVIARDLRAAGVKSLRRATPTVGKDWGDDVEARYE